ncbi:MAG: DUF2510 domain-containing protein [Pseudolysinimonas sp.]
MSDLRQDVIASAPAAGWYPDPANPTSSRWWDGAAWTDHVQAAVVAAVPIAHAVVAPDYAPAYAPMTLEPAVLAPTAPAAIAAAPAFEPVTAPAAPANLDDHGVPLNLFADSVVAPSALVPAAGPASQSDWHNQVGRGRGARRQGNGSVSLSTAVPVARRNDPYERSWMSGLAIVVAILSIPAMALGVAWDLPPLTQSIFGGAPIAIGLLALVASIRRSGRFVLPLIAVVISGLVLLADLLIDPAILKSAVDTVMGLLPA